MARRLLEDVDQMWICNDCKKTFLFDKDVEYHKIKTSHNLSTTDIQIAKK